MDGKGFGRGAGNNVDGGSCWYPRVGYRITEFRRVGRSAL